MNWLNTFELMCYLIVAMMLVDLIYNKDYDGLFLFGAAALVGYFMELAAVRVTGIYFYSTDFWFSIGTVPNQFPVFGGLMWGGVTVYGLKLAQKFGFNKLLTALTTGFLIVTMDLLLDVAAIRLDGGFWTWVGNPIHFSINLSTFMSVIWVNFLGYMIEVPAVIFLTLKKQERVIKTDWKRQTLFLFFIALGGILITAIGSLIALGLNAVTRDAFACVAFLSLWLVMAVLVICRAFRERLRISMHMKRSVPVLLFWLAMYGYCMAALISLGLWSWHPWFLILGGIFSLGTVYLCLAQPEAASF